MNLIKLTIAPNFDSTGSELENDPLYEATIYIAANAILAIRPRGPGAVWVEKDTPPQLTWQTEIDLVWRPMVRVVETVAQVLAQLHPETWTFIPTAYLKDGSWDSAARPVLTGSPEPAQPFKGTITPAPAPDGQRIPGLDDWRPRLDALAAELLEMASDKFADHGCNDWEAPATWTDAQWEVFAAAYEAWNEGEDATDRLRMRDQMMDWEVMAFLAGYFRGEVVIW